jgi:phage repressor protein C with HTH and peptisase S24 domain
MVVGTSMEPRYFAGEAVFVNPRLPVRVGDFVVAQIAADEGEPPLAYVKRYVGQNDKSIRLEQLNPPKKLAFAADRMVSIHRIVMSGEG